MTQILQKTNKTVPDGYKQTEVGVIPQEWDVSILGDSCGLITKGTTPTSLGRNFARSGIRFLKAESISEAGDTIPDKVAFIDEVTHALLKRSQLMFGDLLVSIAGVLGRVGRVENIDLPANTNQALAIVRLGKQSRIIPSFLFYCLRSPVIERQIRDINVQAAQANISLQNVRDFRLPLPSTKAEQEAIAKALSDIDVLIGSLDLLIAKKRDLKQAAMQQLLTGKQRLPGFSGEWEVKRLGEITEIISGGTPKTNEPLYWDGSIKWCTPTDITGCSGKYLVATERTISASGLANCSAQLLPVGSLLLCSRATIGDIRIAACKITTNQGFKSLICHPGVSNEFLYYKLLIMKPKLVERAIGSTFLEISKKDTAALELIMPEYNEQTAIAAVLSDMDAELSALEQRRDKTRALKQGMMQELLTGKTRLI